MWQFFLQLWPMKSLAQISLQFRSKVTIFPATLFTTSLAQESLHFWSHVTYFPATLINEFLGTDFLAISIMSDNFSCHSDQWKLWHRIHCSFQPLWQIFLLSNTLHFGGGLCPPQWVESILRGVGNLKKLCYRDKLHLYGKLLTSWTRIWPFPVFAVTSGFVMPEKSRKKPLFEASFL